MTHTEPLKDLCYLQGEMSRTSYQRVWILSTPTFLYRSSHIFKFIEIPINFSVPRLQCLRLERLCQLVQTCKNHGKTARKKPFDGKNWRHPTISTKSCKIWARQKNEPKTTKSNRLQTVTLCTMAPSMPETFITPPGPTSESWASSHRGPACWAFAKGVEQEWFKNHWLYILNKCTSQMLQTSF